MIKSDGGYVQIEGNIEIVAIDFTCLIMGIYNALRKATDDETAREIIVKCGKDAFEEIERREHEHNNIDRQTGRKS